MLFSSPHSRFLRTRMPAVVLGVATAAVVWVQRNELPPVSLSTLLLLVVIYACAAWVLWRPFRLPVADAVEEQGDTLSIRRGNVGVQVPYSDVQGIEVLKIGITIGAKLVFSKANSLGSEIGFFINDPPEGSGGADPVAHLQGRIDDARGMPPNKSLERTREG
jgi:hypothetical protein